MSTTDHARPRERHRSSEGGVLVPSIVRPTRNESVAVQSYESLREAISAGRLQPGQRLTETALTEMLGVSRTPLREALVRLENEGLITRQQGRVVIAELTVQHLRELFAVRGVLEALAARDAAEGATDEQLTELEQVTDTTEGLQRERAPQSQLVAAGSSFHLCVARLSGNETNFRMIEQVLAHVGRYRSSIAISYAEQHIKEHRAIAAAIMERSAADAAAAMGAHVANSLAAIEQQLGVDSAELETTPQPRGQS